MFSSSINYLFPLPLSFDEFFLIQLDPFSPEPFIRYPSLQSRKTLRSNSTFPTTLIYHYWGRRRARSGLVGRFRIGLGFTRSTTRGKWWEIGGIGARIAERVV